MSTQPDLFTTEACQNERSSFVASRGYTPSNHLAAPLVESGCGGGVGGVLKAISLTQPWATLVMLGEKEYETRCWHTNFRGRVWMHAAKGFPGWAKELCDEEPFRSVLARHGIKSWRELPLGALLGQMDWIDCEKTERVQLRISGQEEQFGDYMPGRFASRLGRIAVLAQPVPCKGALSFWRVPDEVLSAAGAVGWAQRVERSEDKGYNDPKLSDGRESASPQEKGK